MIKFCKQSHFYNNLNKLWYNFVVKLYRKNLDYGTKYKCKRNQRNR